MKKNIKYNCVDRKTVRNIRSFPVIKQTLTAKSVFGILDISSVSKPNKKGFEVYQLFSVIIPKLKGNYEMPNPVLGKNYYESNACQISRLYDEFPAQSTLLKKEKLQKTQGGEK